MSRNRVYPQEFRQKLIELLLPGASLESKALIKAAWISLFTLYLPLSGQKEESFDSALAPRRAVAGIVA
jgi:hypothetical protein